MSQQSDEPLIKRQRRESENVVSPVRHLVPLAAEAVGAQGDGARPDPDINSHEMNLIPASCQ